MDKKKTLARPKPLPNAPMEYAVVEKAESGKYKLYLFRTWPTKIEADFIRADLLKYFTEDSEWHDKLLVVPYKQILPKVRNYN